MNRLFEISILVALLVFVVAFTSYADQDLRLTQFGAPTESVHDRDAAVLVLAAYAAIDYGQSCKMFFQETGYELNPALGKYPSRRDLAAFGLAGLALTWAISRIDHPLARIAVDSIIASERFNIEENERVMDGRNRVIQAIPVIITWRFD